MVSLGDCGYWEEYQVYQIFRNERDDVIGIIVKCGPGDMWVGWDFTILDSEGRAGRMRIGTELKCKNMIERLLITS